MRFDTKLYSDEPMEIVLSRRNLLTLLAKLDGHPPNSNCAITSPGLIVKAEEDDVHYHGRLPGGMIEDTERALLKYIPPPKHIV